MSASCCLMVLNYNGRKHLDDCLGTLLEAARRSTHRCSVVCLDNRSTEPDVEYVRARYPDVEVVVAERNDYLFSLNPAVAARPEEFVVLLNNDMRFDPGFVDPLLEHFRDPEVFAVGSQLMQWDGSGPQNAARRGWTHNAWFYKGWSPRSGGAQYSLEACGGAAAFRRWMFVELGGFDPLFRPGYYEDLDLSYRGWARGWKSVFEPRSIVYHKESVSMKEAFGEAGKTRMHFRNHVLFTAKNIGDWRFLALFLLALPVRALRPLAEGRVFPLLGVLAAVPRLGRALAGRRRGRGAHPSEWVFARVLEAGPDVSAGARRRVAAG